MAAILIFDATRVHTSTHTHTHLWDKRTQKERTIRIAHEMNEKKRIHGQMS